MAIPCRDEVVLLLRMNNVRISGGGTVGGSRRDPNDK
jgi:hypothetical protein